MIYLDNNATTPLGPGVPDAMNHALLQSWGNPSSAHAAGAEANRSVEDAREAVAALLGAADSSEIVFTSGGTESDNWAIIGALQTDTSRKHIVTTRVEHEAIRKLCEKLEQGGYEVTWLDVDERGALDLEQLNDALRPDTAVVSVMMANNETGVVFPIEKIARIVKERSGALFHADGVNAAGKLPIDLKATEVDLFSISAHKFHGPKGVGALYVREGGRIPPMLIGGGQERGRRAGTEAVHQIAGLGAAARYASDLSAMSVVRAMRDRLETGVLDLVAGAHINGDRERRLPNTTNISFEGLNGEMLLYELDRTGICVSTGSACHSDSHSTSPVLQAMNVPYSLSMGSIRFSVGRLNTVDEIDRVLGEIPRIIEKLRLMA